jgi:sugar phosphate isomerase/epimerase
MKTAPIALQLYTIRDFLSKDYAGGVKKVAGMGYAGVETAGFPGTTPDAARKLFQDLGLEVVAAHSALPIGDKKNEVLETMESLGCKRLVCPGLAHDLWSSMDGVKKAADLLNEGYEVAAQNGLSLGFHNHWIEFTKVDGKFAHEILREHVHPKVFFEVDTYWVRVGGGDPVEVVRSLGRRAPLLHIKDGPGEQHAPQLAVGTGVMNFSAIVEAAGECVEWMIVELDSCATDMLEAVQKSHAYLTGKGLAHGK